MKIRNGFVSNSSSSSFVGIGWKFNNRDDFLSLIKEHVTVREYEYIYAYGDSSGDREMLKLAHEACYKPFRIAPLQ